MIIIATTTTTQPLIMIIIANEIPKYLPYAACYMAALWLARWYLFMICMNCVIDIKPYECTRSLSNRLACALHTYFCMIYTYLASFIARWFPHYLFLLFIESACAFRTLHDCRHCRFVGCGYVWYRYK